jgi:catechol 2,3-dioxygenase-like lactoylglutathione lyase family enzyme
MDRACPILPSRDFDATAAFYGAFGFTVARRFDPPQSYLILRRGPVEVHFVEFAVDPATSGFMAYIQADAVDEWADAIRAAALPAAGIPRFADVEAKPWGMRECAVIDPDGTLIRIGTPTEVSGG